MGFLREVVAKLKIKLDEEELLIYPILPLFAFHDLLSAYSHLVCHFDRPECFLPRFLQSDGCLFVLACLPGDDALTSSSHDVFWREQASTHISSRRTLTRRFHLKASGGQATS